MMYSYMTLNDGTEIVHSHVLSDEGGKKVIVHFERPSERGFDDATCELPAYRWTESEGFSEEEISFFKKFLRSNEHLILKYAEKGGIGLANAV